MYSSQCEICKKQVKWHHVCVNVMISHHQITAPLKTTQKWPSRRSFFFCQERLNFKQHLWWLEIFHWPVVLMVRKSMLTMELFSDWSLWTMCMQREIPGSFTETQYTKRLHGQFLFKHLSANVLRFSWIISSHNYNQSKFSPILAIFCSLF